MKERILAGNLHAIVIGGSMAGLCAARVLSRFYDRVTIIDRDSYPAGAHERPGVPQSRHVHALLMRGRLELENLFPGFEKRMLQQGAIEINFGLDFAALRADGWSARAPNKLTTLFASRVLIEATVRELLRKIPGVELIEKAEAIGFETTRGDALRVTGVKVVPRDGAAAYSLTGHLVVDASGRATKVPNWLTALGLPAPNEEVVDSHPGYASRWFERHQERRPSEWWWKGAWIDPVAGETPIGGVMFPVEGDRMIVTLGGVGGHYPPSDEAEFMAMLDRLRSPIIAREVALSDPLSGVYSYRQMANRWRHYEKWGARLDGFVALGDSVCAFNPIYGQGMTSGALSSQILGDILKQNGVGDVEIPRKFFKAQARFQSEPWGLSTGVDFRIPGVEGHRPFISRLLDPIMARLFEVQLDDRAIAERLGEVVNMVKPPSALFELPFLGRIAAAWAKRIVRGAPVRPEFTPMPPLVARQLAA
jgi:2-polyprenyl-6-methoxyphenol hydroxylase-like FAD-dependent oxidoreductase